MHVQYPKSVQDKDNKEKGIENCMYENVKNVERKLFLCKLILFQ